MWTNKVVIITGSSMGIGFALAREIAKNGAKVVLNGSNSTRLEEAGRQLTEEGLDVTTIEADISNFEACNNLIASTIKLHGKIDVLINNAGVSSEASIEEINHEVFQKVIAVNLIGVFNMTKLAIPYLKIQGGNILFIGSVAGFHGIANHAAYCGSKMAITGFAESLKIELHKTKIHVGIAYLGFVENSKSKTILNKNGDRIPQPARNNVSKMSPESISKKLIRMIEKKRFKSVFSPVGNFAYLLNRISPTLMNFILTRIHLKRYMEKGNR